MDIIPLYGQQPLATKDVTVQVSKADRERVKAALARTSEIRTVGTAETFERAKMAAAELKGLINEIVDSKKSAKQPFDRVGQAIVDLANAVGAPVETEHKRILRLMSEWVQRKEDEQRETARQFELRIQLEKDLAGMFHQAPDPVPELPKPQPPKPVEIPGARIDHRYKFELENLAAVIEAGQGRWKLLRWEIDYLACMDEVRAQLERDPDAVPTLPGIKITRETSVSVRAAARTKYE